KKLAVTVVIIAIILSNPNLNPPLKGGRGDVSIWLIVNSCGLGLNVQSSRFKVKKLAVTVVIIAIILSNPNLNPPLKGGRGDVSIWLMVNSCGLGLNVQGSRFKVKKLAVTVGRFVPNKSIILNSEFIISPKSYVFCPTSLVFFKTHNS